MDLTTFCVSSSNNYCSFLVFMFLLQLRELCYMDVFDLYFVLWQPSACTCGRQSWPALWSTFGRTIIQYLIWFDLRALQPCLSCSCIVIRKCNLGSYEHIKWRQWWWWWHATSLRFNPTDLLSYLSTLRITAATVSAAAHDTMFSVLQWAHHHRLRLLPNRIVLRPLVRRVPILLPKPRLVHCELDRVGGRTGSQVVHSRLQTLHGARSSKTTSLISSFITPQRKHWTFTYTHIDEYTHTDKHCHKTRI